jgi:hypothetical protein
MATTSAKILQLQRAVTPVSHAKNNKEIQDTTEFIRGAITWILGILAHPDTSNSRILEWYLWEISDFFRTAPFSTLMLPVLEALADKNPELWSTVKIRDTNMPLTPKAFENIPKSTAEIRDGDWIKVKLQRERELHLLAVYLAKYTQEYSADIVIKHLPVYELANYVIARMFHTLAKNQ